MPSGFLILPDGRCLARRWRAHDGVIRAVAGALSRGSPSHPLSVWLNQQVPGPHDIDELGYGAWLRSSDGATVVRMIDLRRMKPWHQEQFCQAVLDARSAAGGDDAISECLADLAEMVVRFKRGEAPSSKSDWDQVVPQEAGEIGPE